MCLSLYNVYQWAFSQEALDKSLTDKHRATRLTDFFVGSFNIAKAGLLVIVYMLSYFLSFLSSLVINTELSPLSTSPQIPCSIFSSHVPAVSKSRKITISLITWNPNHIFKLKPLYPGVRTGLLMWERPVGPMISLCFSRKKVAELPANYNSNLALGNNISLDIINPWKIPREFDVVGIIQAPESSYLDPFLCDPVI